MSGQRVLRFLSDTLRQRSDTDVTTFFDLYGLPTDFPGITVSPRDPVQRATAIGTALAGRIGLGRIREECRHFAAWFSPFESLSALV